MTHVKKYHAVSPQYADALKHVQEIRFSRSTSNDVSESAVRVQCPLCDKTFDACQILPHIRWVHSDIGDLQGALRAARKSISAFKKHRQLEEQQEKTACPHCGKTLRLISLQNHIKYYCSRAVGPTSDNDKANCQSAPVSDDCKVPGGRRTSKTCEICGKVLLLTKYGRHRRLVHRISVYKPVETLACNFCPKEFLEPHQLKAHLRKHTSM